MKSFLYFVKVYLVMAMQPDRVKALLSAKKWRMVDLAARWGISVVWMSRLVNEPNTRPPHYDDAFAGLPICDKDAVTREPRHNRTSKKTVKASDTTGFVNGRMELFPIGRVLEAIDNTYFDEGTRFVVVGSTLSQLTSAQDTPVFSLRVCDTTETIDISQDDVVLRFADLGLEEPV